MLEDKCHGILFAHGMKTLVHGAYFAREWSQYKPAANFCLLFGDVVAIWWLWLCFKQQVHKPQKRQELLRHTLKDQFWQYYMRPNQL